MHDSESVLTRRFDRPPDHCEKAMKAELAGLPGTWRIYGIDSFGRGRDYHVEFRVAGDRLEALKIALEQLDVVPALLHNVEDSQIEPT